jgi:hypothetical protein
VSPSVTGVPGLGGGAYLAAHVTTPVEGAAAPLSRDVRLGFEPATTTHQVTPVDADGRRVAFPPLGAMETDDVVMVTEVGRVFEVDEVPPARFLVVGVCWVKVESLPSPAASPVVPHVPLVTCNHTSQVTIT